MTTMPRIIILIGAIIGLWFVFGFVSPRLAYFHLAVVALITLPALRWTGRRIWPMSAILVAASLTFATTPFDFTVQSTGRPEITVLPVSNGPACNPGVEVCYGCVVVPRQPSHAVVLSLK